MKHKLIGILMLMTGLSFADDIISSAYQFRSCYQFQFNKQLLSENVEYNVINKLGISVDSGTIDANKPYFIFCEHNVFENHTPNTSIAGQRHPFEYFINGIEPRDRIVQSDFVVILKNKTQNKIDEFNRVNFSVDHRFDLIPSNFGMSLDKATHSLKFITTSSPAVFITNAENPEVEASFSSNLKLLSDSGVRDSRYKISSTQKGGKLSDLFTSNDGWGMLKCTGICNMSTGGIVDYENAFIPKMLAISELYTYYVAFDSNPSTLPDLTKSEIKSVSKEVNLDYKYADQDTRISRTSSSNMSTYDYVAKYDTSVNYKEPVLLFLENPNNPDEYPNCGAFDYDHNTGIITGYCNPDGSIIGNLKKVSFNLKSCSRNGIEINGQKISCAEDRVKTNPYAILPRTSSRRICPANSTLQYILTGVAHQNNLPDALCRHQSRGYYSSTIEYVSDEGHVKEHTGDDWAVNWAKRECPVGKVAIGITMLNASSTLICATPVDPIAKSGKCIPKWFNTSDNGYIEHNGIGDWAYNSYKVEVGNGHYIGGIASYYNDPSVSAYSVILDCEM